MRFCRRTGCLGGEQTGFPVSGGLRYNNDARHGSALLGCSAAGSAGKEHKSKPHSMEEP